MNTHKNLILALAVLVLGTANAGPVTPKRAATVAQNFFNTVSATKSNAQLEPCNTQWQYEGIYLFTATNGGFVLVAADDAARPILGYSPNGTLDPANMSPALQQWLQGYQQEITALQNAKGYPVHAEWYALEQGLFPKDGDSAVVGPLITTFWDQTYPYNGYCPGGSAVGCAATAQAQVMNFWKHPAFGMGSHSYTHARYGVQSADFAHTMYDWDHMPTMATYSSPMVEKEAVALLMYHCGVSLDMGYDPNGSAAAGLAGMPGFASIDNSLKDYFGYSASMRVVSRGYYTKDQWRDLLTAELDLGHPIVYVGSGDAGGHGFVCDGYDNRGYLHFNFGWSGRGDGYFPVDSITPGTGGVGGGSYSFNMNNSALLGLVPDYRMRVSDTLFSMGRDGGADSLLFAPNGSVYSMWNIVCDADWLTLQIDTIVRAGWVHFAVPENTSGQERVAVITFTQGSEHLTVRVVQAAYSEEDMCPVTVVMESTHGDGWQGGANLVLQSEAGFVYGTAQLEQSSKDSVVILVPPTALQTVWNTGGGTDRYVNYSVKNRHGETLVSVRNAYRNGGTHHIEQPCDHLGIEESHADALQIYPNPASDVLHIQAEGLQRVELMDMSGRTLVSTSTPHLDLSHLTPGAYFVRVITTRNTSVKRFIKK